MPASFLLPVLRRSRRLRALVSVVTLASMFLLPLRAESTTWWTTQGVLSPGKSADDFAVLNQGQLKNLATKAAAEMNATLADGAGEAINSMVQAWRAQRNQADDYAVATLGQLKSVSALFYDRLGLPYPWSSSLHSPDDYAVANLGQAKAVFSFSVPKQPLSQDWLQWLQAHGIPVNATPTDDSDNDGLTDAEEYAHGTSPSNGDTDNDGVPDADELAQGTNPLDASSHPVYYIPGDAGAFTYLPPDYMDSYVSADGAYGSSVLPGVYMGWHNHYFMWGGWSSYSQQYGVYSFGTLTTMGRTGEPGQWSRSAYNESTSQLTKEWVAAELLTDSSRYEGDTTTAGEPWSLSNWDANSWSSCVWGRFGIALQNRTFDRASATDSEIRLQATNPVGADVVRTYLIVDEIVGDRPGGLGLGWESSDDEPLFGGVAATASGQTWAKPVELDDVSYAYKTEVKPGTDITYEVKGKVTMTISKDHALCQSIEVEADPSLPEGALTVRSGADPRFHPRNSDGTLSNASDFFQALYIAPPEPQVNKGVTRRLLPVEIESKDRAVTGKIPNLGKMFGSKPFKLGFKAGSKDLGSYDIPDSGSTETVKIYDDADDEKTGIFGDDELADPEATQAKLKNQEVVLAREGDSIRFYTVSDNISKFTVSLYVDGTKVADIEHELKSDDEFGEFIGTIEKFVGGDAPPSLGSGPTPIILAAANPPQLSDEQTQQLLALVPVGLRGVFPSKAARLTSFEGEVTPAIASAVDTTFAEAFLAWVHEVKDTLPEENWVPVFAFLNAVGYDTNAALAPRLAGWNPAIPGDNLSLLPERIRNRALVAKTLIRWLGKTAQAGSAVVHTMKLGVAGGKGVVFGIWDGTKSEWEDLKQFGDLWEALKHPYQSASELYHTFEMLKELDGPKVKAIAVQMFNAFVHEQATNLAWSDPEDVTEALRNYMAGYMVGYITEQVAVAAAVGIITGGAGLAIKAGKAGKILRTVFEAVEKFKAAVKVVVTVKLVEGKLPKIFLARMTKLIQGIRLEDDLRTVRKAAAKISKQTVPNLETDIAKCLKSADGNHHAGLRDWYNKRGINLGTDEAHHLIPYENCNHDLIQRAARGGFDLNNGDLNGLPLHPNYHRPPPNRNHPEYRAAVRAMLDDILLEAPNISDKDAADILNRAAQVLREVVVEASIPLR